MANELALDAIGNPTRREMLRLLQGGEQTVADLTASLPMTQSAVSQHLRVLREANLVSVREAGTRRLYSVDLDGLGEIRAWVDGFWDDILAAFTAHAERQPTAAGKTPKKTANSKKTSKNDRDNT